MHVLSGGAGELDWPGAMRLHFEERDHEAFALLFTRAVWALPVTSSLPDLDPMPAPMVRPSSIDAIADEWEWSWQSWAEHVGDFDDFDVEARGLDAYFAAWQQAQRSRPRPWADRFPSLFAGPEYAQWEEAVVGAAPTAVSNDLEELVVDAWRGGLTHISLLPLQGSFAERLGPHRLAVSHETWRSGAVAAALARWPEV